MTNINLVKLSKWLRHKRDNAQTEEEKKELTQAINWLNSGMYDYEETLKRMVHIGWRYGESSYNPKDFED